MEGNTGRPIGSTERFSKRAVQADNSLRMVLRPVNGYLRRDNVFPEDVV